MKSKLPLISYVVYTKFVTNGAGLRYIHKEAFTDEDPRIAKTQAKEYFDAAVEILMDMKEISVLKEDRYSKEKIIYKNPEEYDGGIAIFMRLNADVELKGKICKLGRMFLLNIFTDVDRDITVKKHLAKKVEQQMWNLMGFKTDKQLCELDELYKNRLGVKRAARKNELSQRIAVNDTTLIQIIRNINEIGLISESICAFLNTEGGEIVIGIDEHLSPTGFLPNEDFETFRDMLTNTVYKMFMGFEALIEFDLKQINENNFYYFKVNRSATPAFIIEKHGMEFYYRNLAGNVHDFDRTE
ncbi:MAG: ATP-binding protein [Weeksellaceae bacterium]|nr:ATP-binding protein [Bacteroidota bacterium]MCG2780376.1 ATP-binding protein [Weeksellaceae bacterium]